MTFRAPTNAMAYLFKHAVDTDVVLATDRYSEVNSELVGDILAGAASFSEDVLAPTNWDGDQNPAQIDNDQITTSPGFKEAYASYVEAGWQGLSAPSEIGGMDLPQSVSVCANEMIYAANMAFGLCPMLTASAMKAIHAHASTELQETYLPKMVTGEWSGAMNLTEPQAGSDLGVLRAKAEPNGDGTYAVSGQKIYITWGDHDCAENIVHLVLARLPDAPAGSRGISLFLCPKRFVNADGTLGAGNSLKPIGLEHKLGIHGSPTCVMEFDKATGWLVGEPNRGLAAMFTMMNEARLFVGVQGVAIGERAYQAALAYAEERVQGKVAGHAEPNATIIHHPDVRRMLIDMKTRLMAARAICLATAVAGDIALATDDDTARKLAHTKEALLTPVAKAYGSDTGVEVASIGIQVHGGMGFVEETGAAQHYRDARIAPIYEGTNGIQAIDLVGRKLRRDGGEGMRALIAEIAAIIDSALNSGDQLAVEAEALRTGLEALSTATDIILNSEDNSALSGATPFLSLLAQVYGGALLIRSVVNGRAANDARAEAMADLARYHALAILPQAGSQLALLRAGQEAVFAFPQTALSDL